MGRRRGEDALPEGARQNVRPERTRRRHEGETRGDGKDEGARLQ